MNSEERERLMVEMCKKWPKRFTDHDLSHWCQQLNQYDVDAIIAALTAYKAESKYVPKLHEIRQRLAAKPSAFTPRQQKYQTVIAQGVAAANHVLDGRPEAELVLRYHRSWGLRYAANSAKPELTATHWEIAKRQCAIDLFDLVGKDQAEALAGWIDASQPDFDGVCASITAEREMAE